MWLCNENLCLLKDIELLKWCAKNGYVVLTYMRMIAYRVLDTRLDNDSTRSIAYRVLVSALDIT